MIEYNLTNAELAILSLIAETPRHGYELEQVIEERGMRSWTEIAFSSIYFTLSRLVKQGLASSSLQPAAGRGPAKKVFTSTPEGHAALKQGVQSSISNLEPSGQRFLLGLSSLPLLTPEEIELAFQSRMTALDREITNLSKNPALRQPGIPKHVVAMFDYSLVQLRSEMEWSKNFLDSYKVERFNYGKTRP